MTPDVPGFVMLQFQGPWGWTGLQDVTGAMFCAVPTADVAKFRGRRMSHGWRPGIIKTIEALSRHGDVPGARHAAYSDAGSPQVPLSVFMIWNGDWWCQWTARSDRPFQKVTVSAIELKRLDR